MTEIIGRGAALLSVLRSTGQWTTRTQLAEATGKKQLSPNDRNWLATLERDGLIEVRKQTINAPVGFEWQYRATEQD